MNNNENMAEHFPEHSIMLLALVFKRNYLPLVRSFVVVVNFVTETTMNYCFVVSVAKADLHLVDLVQQ